MLTEYTSLFTLLVLDTNAYKLLNVCTLVFEKTVANIQEFHVRMNADITSGNSHINL